MITPSHTRALRDEYTRTQLTAALERALFRVATATANTPNNQAFDKRAMLSVLADAIVCCVYGGAAADFAPYAWTPEAPTILTALRHELLCGRSRRQLSDGDLLQVVIAIEQLDVLLQGDMAVRFVQQFSGRQAQQRLVELAHDMRSPLNAILLLVERMQHGASGPVTSVQQHNLALVYSAAFGLSSMANDLMDLARGGARLLAEAPRVFSIAEMLRAVRDVVQPLAEERGVSLRFSGPPEDKRIGQVSAINRVLQNLTTNALKFTTVGSVTVMVSQEPDEDELSFVVEDTGRGIPEPELMDIFSSISSSTADSLPGGRPGDGLGLAICQKLVSAMQGTITAESRVDHGSRFIFKLRLPPEPQ